MSPLLLASVLCFLLPSALSDADLGCMRPGQCLDSNVAREFPSPSFEACRKSCREEYEDFDEAYCHSFTYYADLGVRVEEAKSTISAWSHVITFHPTPTTVYVRRFAFTIIGAKSWTRAALTASPEMRSAIPKTRTGRFAFTRVSGMIN